MYAWDISTAQPTFYSGIFTAYLCMIFVCAKLGQVTATSHLFCPLRKRNAPLLPEGTAKCTHMEAISSSQRMPTEINESGAIAKIRISVETLSNI